jgi:RHS repeat-associated protein
MPVTRYLHANGVAIAQKTGSTRTDYLTDGLGSITATKNQSQQIVNTYRYKPSGELLTKTGAAPDPRFMHAGNSGSQHTARYYAEQYNWHRHYGSKQGQWTSVDPIWPMEKPYRYGESNPTTYIDPNGFQKFLPNNGAAGNIFPRVSPPQGLPIPVPGKGRCEDWNQFIYEYCTKCYSKPFLLPNCQLYCNIISDWYHNNCSGGNRKRFDGDRWIPYPGTPGAAIAPTYPRFTPGTEDLTQCRRQDFVQSINPMVFGYGNCCGYDRRCNKNSNVIDCLDAACRDHDSSIPTGKEFVRGKPHLIFCVQLSRCDCDEHYKPGTKAHDQCKSARIQMMIAYCPVGFGLPQ